MPCLCVAPARASLFPVGSTLDFLKNFNFAARPGFNLAITSNGQLLTPKAWEAVKNCHEVVDSIHISVNAGTPETYGHVQKGGTGGPLMENFAFIKQMRDTDAIRYFSLGYYVQHNNFNELRPFIEMAKAHSVDRVFLGIVQDWQSYAPEVYRLIDIGNPTHPLHAEFLAAMRDPILRGPIVDIGNILPYLDTLPPAAPAPPSYPARHLIWEEFVVELDLSLAQEDAVRKIVNQFKKELSEIFDITGPDGRSAIDIIAQAVEQGPLAGPAAQAEMDEAMASYTATAVHPDSGQTVQQCIAAAGAVCSDAICAVLSSEQLLQYQQIDPNQIFGFNTGYDPQSEAINARLGQRASAPLAASH